MVYHDMMYKLAAIKSISLTLIFIDGNFLICVAWIGYTYNLGSVNTGLTSTDWRIIIGILDGLSWYDVYMLLCIISFVQLQN